MLIYGDEAGFKVTTYYPINSAVYQLLVLNNYSYVETAAYVFAYNIKQWKTMTYKAFTFTFTFIASTTVKATTLTTTTHLDEELKVLLLS